jgi:hypothetical protein
VQDAPATRCYTAEGCASDRANCERAECHIRGMGWTNKTDSRCDQVSSSFRGGACSPRLGGTDLRVWR